jgi:hypothetical protein
MILQGGHVIAQVIRNGIIAMVNNMDGIKKIINQKVM